MQGSCVLYMYELLFIEETDLLGLGQVIVSTLVLEPSSRLFDDPPGFLLTARSRKGPPTTSIWKRNGVNITYNDSFEFNLRARCDIEGGCLDSIYESNLRVTGYLPGEYQYIVSNIARTSHSTMSITIHG